MAGDVVQAEECWPYKCKALNSTPALIKKKKRRKRKRRKKKKKCNSIYFQDV
jgi:hypothetical protein